MSAKNEQCIHDLDEGTCSLCAEHEEGVGEPVTLRAIVAKAFEQYGDEDEELVLRLVIAEVIQRDDAADLLLPALRAVRREIEASPRLRVEHRALGYIGRMLLPSSRPEAINGAKSKVRAPAVALPPLDVHCYHECGITALA